MEVRESAVVEVITRGCGGAVLRGKKYLAAWSRNTPQLEQNVRPKSDKVKRI